MTTTSPTPSVEELARIIDELKIVKPALDALVRMGQTNLETLKQGTPAMIRRSDVFAAAEFPVIHAGQALRFAERLLSRLQTEGTKGEEASPWPDGKFTVLDPDPSDEHGPIYLVTPGGLMVNFSNDLTPGLDQARVEWIATKLNALASRPTTAEAQVAEECPYPVLKESGHCCKSKCTLEWKRPCDDQGGCLDRQTCGGCDEPVYQSDTIANLTAQLAQSRAETELAVEALRKIDNPHTPKREYNSIARTALAAITGEKI